MIRGDDETLKQAYQKDSLGSGTTVRLEVMKRVHALGPLKEKEEPLGGVYRIAVTSACAMGTALLILGFIMTKNIQTARDDGFYKYPIFYADLSY